MEVVAGGKSQVVAPVLGRREIVAVINPLELLFNPRERIGQRSL
jgi:hypothetical protein